MSPQDRRTAAALAFAEAAWRAHKALALVQRVSLRRAGTATFAITREWVAEGKALSTARHEACAAEQEARQAWFALAAEAEAAGVVAPTSDSRRDAILALIAEALPQLPKVAAHD